MPSFFDQIAMMSGAAPGAGPNDEEERQRQDAMAKLASLYNPRQQAAQALTGGLGSQGPMPAAAPAPPAQQGPWNPSVSGPSGTDRYSFSQGAGGEWSGGLTGRSGGGFMTPGVDPNAPVTGAAGIQKAFADALARHTGQLSGGSMFAGPEVNLAASKLASAEVAPHMAAMDNEARLKEAMVKHQLEHSPEAIYQKFFQNTYGLERGMGLSDESARERARDAATQEIAHYKKMFPQTGGVGTGPGAGAAGGALAGPAGPPTGSEVLSKPTAKQEEGGLNWLRQNIQEGKPLQAENILKDVSTLAAQNPKEAEVALKKLMDNNPEARKALMHTAAADAFGYLDTNAPQMRDAKGNLPGYLDIQDTPFAYVAPETGTSLGGLIKNYTDSAHQRGMPYTQFKNKLTGETLPLDLSGRYSSHINPASDTQGQLNRQVQERTLGRQILFKLMGFQPPK